MKSHYLFNTLLVACVVAWTTPTSVAGQESTAAETAASATVLMTKAGLRFGIWPKKPEKPAPTLFIFGSSIEETLNSPYFRQCGNQLSKHGVLCVSVDLPGHGSNLLPGEPAGIEAWRFRCEKGQNFVAQATDQFKAVLDELIELKLTDPTQVGACGTSRGGFMALQFAVAEERVRCAAAFAPVTQLTALREFNNVSKRELADQLSVLPTAEKLAGKAIWVIIGDQDERVSTDASIAFCRAVTLASLKQKKPARVDLHVVAEPQGHTTPKGAADLATTWFETQFGLKSM